MNKSKTDNYTWWRMWPFMVALIFTGAFFIDANKSLIETLYRYAVWNSADVVVEAISRKCHMMRIVGGDVDYGKEVNCELENKLRLEDKRGIWIVSSRNFLDVALVGDNSLHWSVNALDYSPNALIGQTIHVLISRREPRQIAHFPSELENRSLTTSLLPSFLMFSFISLSTIVIINMPTQKKDKA